jgi:hypothetical protein
MISAAKSAQYQGTTMETVPAAIGSAVEVWPVVNGNYTCDLNVGVSITCVEQDIH